MSTATAPTAVCPKWCTVTQEEHAEELTSPIAGGDVMHQSAPGSWATLSDVRQADGSDSPYDRPTELLVCGQDVTPDEAEEIVRQIRAALAALPV